MEVSDMQALLDKARHLKQPERERTLFDIGARGYFENPTTDLLAFFLDPSAEHGFGSVVLNALLDCLPEPEQPSSDDGYLTRSPIREWMTSEQQRIDLVLESDRWVLAIENKIYHGFHNDFDHYGSDLKLRLSGQKSRRVLLAVLSPEGLAPNVDEWLGIGYADFLKQLRAAIGALYEQHGESKWLLFLREFVLHFENLTMADTLTNEQEQYVLEHLGDIDALTRAKNSALLNLRQRLQAGINDSLSDIGQSINVWQENWPVGPALRFAPEGWKGHSSVVIYLELEKSKQVWVQTYIDRRNGDLAQLAEKGFDCNQFDDHKVGKWQYNLYHGFLEMKWEAIEKAVANYLRGIIAMEKDWQREVAMESENGR
ncbi:hypothetical protein HVA01_06800 [Halovibrio variabilis]|uniref:PD-(D/E)XK nuclease superfamily protein n=1 Tax=Halovibrio variabilis TaxID=31910 RepID=A0A511UKC4_9GAMM|nr:PD-(D/E)XK nuclease family protein [Halovibrio variabilis]GEN27034.1 hypothetical protein HVA01_06800 [Halovibrio variabilis]